MHYGCRVYEVLLKVELVEVVKGKGDISLHVPNLNNEPLQLILKDVMGSDFVW